MTIQLTNNATSRLASSITTTSTAVSVQAGDGAKFPALTAGDWFPVTLLKADGQLEICRCTARTGDQLTIVRAQENTTAKAFSSGDRIESRLTAAAIGAVRTEATEAALAYHGQCRFEYVSATECRLLPYNGDGLVINGKQERIPSAGVSLSNSVMPPGALAYVYAYMNGATMALEVSSSLVPVKNSNGVMVKTGDASRTLVGMAIVPAADGQFKNELARRYVASWFNRIQRTMLEWATPVTGSDTYVQLNSGAGVLVWAGDVVQTIVSGQTSSATRSGSYIRLAVNANPASGGYGYSLYAGSQMAFSFMHNATAPTTNLYNFTCQGMGTGNPGAVAWAFDQHGLIWQ